MSGVSSRRSHPVQAGRRAFIAAAILIAMAGCDPAFDENLMGDPAEVGEIGQGDVPCNGLGQMGVVVGDPCIDDEDEDGWPDDRDNCPYDANPDQLDSDGDGPGDACDLPEGGIDLEACYAEVCDGIDNDCDGTTDETLTRPCLTQCGDGLERCVAGAWAGCDAQTPFAEICDLGDNDCDGEVDEGTCDDSDGDGVPDVFDGCPGAADDGSDTDGDTWGDACDHDDDNDGIPDEEDNCPQVRGVSVDDTDDDGEGDLCDDDDDGDGILDADDRCPLNPHPDCWPDQDFDGIDAPEDNCPDVANRGQADGDGDGIGDACDPDVDGDGVEDDEDNCPDDANPDQDDADGDGLGDACQTDTDGDGVGDHIDNCPRVPNPAQEDQDGDGIGDACANDDEPWPEPEPEPGDVDGDGIRDGGEVDPGVPGEPGDVFDAVDDNPWTLVADEPRSTFSTDPDTASYTVMRRALRDGQAVPPASVRVEEYLNFFEYDYAPPAPIIAHPFAIHLEGAPSPFGQGLHLLRIGLQGREVAPDQRRPANLVFLLDVSGSMRSPDKLGLVQTSMRRLLAGLRPSDTVAVVTYAGADEVRLRPTPVAHRGEILEIIDQLQAGGSTNGADGIRTAYALAEGAFVEGGINRVILCTDGDFNVGARDEELVQLVEGWRDRGILLSVLGYGRGNLNDAFIEQITNRANGNYAYIDSENEALRVLGRNLEGTLEVIAADVKVQAEFAPGVVRRYRLIGYQNRVLANEDFRDDEVDAAELGSGHAVTALYEVELVDGVPDPARVATVRVRYKEPDDLEVAFEVARALGRGDVIDELADASADLRLAAAVSEFAEILADSVHSVGARLADVRALVVGTDPAPGSDRAELIDLIDAVIQRRAAP